MKNLIKSTIILFAAALLFTGCSGFTEKQNTPKTYTVSGTLNVPGAEDNYASRTAIVSFDAVDWDVVAYPKKGTGYDSASPNYADSVTGKTFSLSLTEGDWLIEAYTHGPRDQAYFMGETTITVTNSNISNVVISVVPFDQNSGTCTVELTFKEAEGLSINSVTADWGDAAINNDLAAQNELTAYFTGNSATLTMNNVPSGAYLVTFTFKDASEKTVYSCKEMVNVLPYATTDTWAGNSVYITPDGDFLLTQDILDSYTDVALVSEGTPYVLYNYLYDYMGDVTTHELKIFANLDGETRIVTDSGITFDTFCFGDDCVWVLDGTQIKKYSQTYSGFAEEEVYSIGSLLGGASFSADQIADLLAYYNNKLYFACEAANKDYGIIEYDLDTKQINISDPISYQVIEQWSSLVVNDNAFYYITTEGGSKIVKQTFTISGVNITFDPNGKKEYYPSASDHIYSDFEFYCSDSLAFGDLQIVGNTLYATVYCNGQYQSYYNDQRERLFGQWANNGGVIKFDISDPDADLELVEWNTANPETGNNKILGWYVLPDSNGISYCDDRGYSKNYEKAISVQPPLDQSEAVYFYGARKFVARKPDKLVIVDDGGYCDDDDGDDVSKDRVITLDLLTESLSAEDVSVAFTANYVATSPGYFSDIPNSN